MSDRIKLKLGESSALVMCQFNSMAEILSAAFGGSGDSSPSRGKDVTAGCKTPEQALHNINSLLNFG